MKRLFSAIIALVAVISLQAANTEVARLTLTADGSPAASNITVRVDPTVMVAETGSYFENTELAENVNIYVTAGGSNYSSYKLNEIVNLHIAILTNRRPAANQLYTLTFNVPTINEGLKLKDLKTGDERNIVNGDTYEFEVNTTLHPTYVEGTNFRIEDRFVINYEPVDPSVLDVCFNKQAKNLLKINANPWSDGRIVICDKNDVQVGDVHLGTETDIDLTALTPVSEEAKQRYIVKFFPTSVITGEPAKKLVIVPVP